MSKLPEEFLGELRLGRQLTTVSQIAARGAVILIGTLILLTDQTLALLGRIAPLAGFLVAVVIGLSLLSIIELFGGSRERGGTYSLVHEILGGVFSFLTGWSLLAASLCLVGALAREAAAQLLILISADGMSVSVVAIVIIALTIIMQLFQVLPGRLDFRSVTLLLLVAIGLVLLFALPRFSSQAFRARPSGEFSVLDHGVASLSVIYVAFESLLASRRQVRDPSRDLPAALFGTLVFAGLAFPLVFFTLLGLESQSIPFTNELIIHLSGASFLPSWLVAAVVILALIIAANTCMMTGVRQIHALSREGALPRSLRRVWQPIPMPVGLFAVLTLFLVPLILWGNANWLINVSAGLILTVLVVLNIAAIYSQRTEPERRRSFVVPFAPLVPALSVGINLILMRALPSGALLSSGAWLLLGLGYYFVYAHHQQVEAQVGEIVFGRTERRKEETGYRIVVPIGPVDERQMILRMASSLAYQLHGEVIPLQVIPVPDPLAIEEGRRTAQERNILFRWSTRVAEDMGVPVYPITRLARNTPEGIIDTANEEECDLVLMSWPLKKSGEDIHTGSVLERVAPNVRADVAVMAYHPATVKELREEVESGNQGDGKHQSDEQRQDEFSFHPARILVPTAGGPHAPLAFRIALLLARQYESTVTAVYVVEPDASEEEIALGDERIQATIAAMREQAKELPSFNGRRQSIEEIPFEGRIIRSTDVITGIADAGAEYDLVLVGASEESFIDQVLFGNIPEHVARECPSPVVIVKRYRGLPRMWLRRSWNALFEALPTLNQEEQIEVYRSIHRGARPDVDFFVMIALSAIIATFGLLMNSNAVIIGAMLVAPLFSPLLAISLSLIQGNVRLLRLALESTLQGVTLAIAVATLLPLIVPFTSLTAEIMARSQPTLFDLVVALASGAAGAYAVARADVAAALPGVAIAAALVPPLGVIGIGLSMGKLGVAGGASLLFATNLVAIALSGAITFLLLGFRPGARGAREMHLRRGLVVTIVLFVLVAIPLAYFFSQSLRAFQTRQLIQDNLALIMEETSDVELVDRDDIEVRDQAGELVVTVPIYVRGTVTRSFAISLSDHLSELVEKPVSVRVVTFPLVESSP
ncbi:MAG TPA: amino acid permease [Anaerolineales bacterium]